MQISGKDWDGRLAFLRDCKNLFDGIVRRSFFVGELGLELQRDVAPKSKSPRLRCLGLKHRIQQPPLLVQLAKSGVVDRRHGRLLINLSCTFIALCGVSANLMQVVCRAPMSAATHSVSGGSAQCAGISAGTITRSRPDEVGTPENRLSQSRQVANRMVAACKTNWFQLHLDWHGICELCLATHTESEPEMINLTDSAINALKAAISSTAQPASGLRVMVEGGGCQGFTYKMGLAHEPVSDEPVFEQEGIKVFVDNASRAHHN